MYSLSRWYAVAMNSSAGFRANPAATYETATSARVAGSIKDAFLQTRGQDLIR
jgi:hypothetical protein